LHLACEQNRTAKHKVHKIRSQVNLGIRLQSTASTHSTDGKYQALVQLQTLRSLTLLCEHYNLLRSSKASENLLQHVHLTTADIRKAN
jgi:hypothetical protein